MHVLAIGQFCDLGHRRPVSACSQNSKFLLNEIVGEPIKPVVVPTADEFGADTCGVLAQYPTTDGRIVDYSAIAERVHEARALFCVAADVMAFVVSGGVSGHTARRPDHEFETEHGLESVT